MHESAEIQHFCDSTPNEYKDDVNEDSDPEPSQEDAKGAKTPMEAKPCLDEDKELEDTPYRELIGGLLYLSLRTRPDITFAVTKLAQYSSNYNRSHWNSAKRILRYLKDTRGIIRNDHQRRSFRGGIVVIHTATTLAALAQRSDDIRVHACFQYLV